MVRRAHRGGGGGGGARQSDMARFDCESPSLVAAIIGRVPPPTPPPDICPSRTPAPENYLRGTSVFPVRVKV